MLIYKHGTQIPKPIFLKNNRLKFNNSLYLLGQMLVKLQFLRKSCTSKWEEKRNSTNY